MSRDASLPKNLINSSPAQRFKQQVIDDFKTACLSREMSLAGRKEVLGGKGKFGIFGDGKEITQVALARSFKPGDFRSGYYRDQTWMLALGVITPTQFFAQLYADSNPDNEPMSHGRQMNAHFATPLIDQEGNWLELKSRYNVAADASSTASQMPRAVGLALASKFYRNNPELQSDNKFSTKGQEVCFVSIGDASTSEGHFWEAINAAGVLKIPMITVVYDDGYGISVPKKYQTTKESISEVLSGFQVDDHDEGVIIVKAKAWDYPGLVQTFEKISNLVREKHIPALIHVEEVTQPQGHSTSGSHERYKSEERLAWEQNADGIQRMGTWLMEKAILTEEEVNQIKKEAKKTANTAKREAWKAYQQPILDKAKELEILLEQSNQVTISHLQASVKNLYNPGYSDLVRLAKEAHRILRRNNLSDQNLVLFIEELSNWGQETYQSHWISETKKSTKNVSTINAEFDEQEEVNGFEVLNAAFDAALARNPSVIAFGEDVGKIGDVNQAFAGLQEKYGEHRVFDTGIRELTIMGQAIGMAMRGLRPIAEIQYLDYLIYGLQPLTDDVATLTYRTAGQQRSPVIIRTRGHRLEGIWHTGSPMGMVLNSLRGMNVCVPRNMTQAAGMYNTLLEGDEPAIVVECLNGYRLKERCPSNIGEFTVPMGEVETLQQGDDVTLVTYGSCVRIAQQAMAMLEEDDISVELIDIQTLLPFDCAKNILESIKKTNRVAVLDEDVPGGASGFILQQIIEEQGAYQYLDSPPVTISARPHRSAYGSDADYWSKPSADDVYASVYNLMHEVDPGNYPK
ncbi:MAG: alpha-ketoacid dehydrogenase subunit alpha/beta [Chitinophagales bacterium]